MITYYIAGIMVMCAVMCVGGYCSDVWEHEQDRLALEQEPDMTQLEWEQNRSFWAATVKRYCPYEEFIRRAFAPEECR